MTSQNERRRRMSKNKMKLLSALYPNYDLSLLSKFPSLATFIQIPLTGHYLPAACLLLFAVDDKSSLEQVVDVFMKF